MSFSLAKNIDFQVLKRVLGHTFPYRKVFWLTVILAVLLAPVSTMKPWLINRGVDEYIFKNDPHGLLYIVLLFAIVISVEVVFRYLFIFNSNWLGQSVIRDIRVKLFKHVTSLKLKYFDDTPIGTITTRTVNDIEAINEIFAEGLMTIIADVLMIVVILVVMLLTSVKLTLICLALLPLLLWGSYIFKENVKKAFNRVRNSLANMNAFLQERISGMRIVQIFNAEEGEIEKFRTINRKYTQANLDTILYYAIFFPFVEMISAASLGLMVWWGTRGILDNSVTAGTLVAFPIYINMLFRPVRMLADKFNTLQMGLVAADRVFEVLDDERMIENKGRFIPEKIHGKIAFNHVWFAYNDDNYVIQDLSFDIKPGESLAIVGSTGSGKTTIINILNRFYEIDKGEILIDDISISDYGLEELRKRMAIVIQDVFLFTGTVLENITLQSTQFSEEDVKKAAELIGADRFIDELPGGYDYKILERGNNLSVGQRQLISFVRAMLFNPDILILDEATSSIDTKTESIIQHAIETLTEKRTSIIIAHRLSTIRNADKILVMKKGKMVEFGTHNELIKNMNGPYSQMYHMQFDKKSADIS